MFIEWRADRDLSKETTPSLVGRREPEILAENRRPRSEKVPADYIMSSGENRQYLAEKSTFRRQISIEWRTDRDLSKETTRSLVGPRQPEILAENCRPRSEMKPQAREKIANISAKS